MWMPSRELRLIFYTTLFVVYFVFFFQAEDGIRDLTVTGVQTCALPIFPRSLSGKSLALVDLSRPVRSLTVAALLHCAGSLGARSYETGNRAATVRERRSEERRVGKECRSRWSPYH